MFKLKRIGTHPVKVLFSVEGTYLTLLRLLIL